MEFIEHQWESYKELRFNKDKRNRQVSLLYGSGLCESNDGVEFCFVPTIRMKELERQIKSLYDELKVTDNKIVICNEVYYTSKIEGAKTTFKRTQEIHNGSPIDHSNYFSEMMVRGGFEATKYLNVRGNKLNKDILIEMWNILTDGCCDNEDIKGESYRTGNVGVGNHMGLSYQLLDETMDNWLAYYNSESLNEHPFIKAALLHYAFEFIHPFCDGNGRAGRLLMINFLIGLGYDKLKAVSFSKTIAESYNKYYAAFEDSENVYTDCTLFIEYMLSVFRDSIDDASGFSSMLSAICKKMSE